MMLWNGKIKNDKKLPYGFPCGSFAFYGYKVLKICKIYGIISISDFILREILIRYIRTGG